MANASLFCPWAWLPEGWSRDVVLEIEDGRIQHVRIGASPDGHSVLAGPVVPGIANAHSHAFQWAMAGLAERAVDPADSFWSWRRTMYEFVEALQPEHVEAIAAQLYIEMLRAGYTSVAEFHYLHHQRDGSAYLEPAEMALRHVSAARTAGIGLTMLPVLYARGGFDGRALQGGQRRFQSDPVWIARVIERLRAAAPEVRVGAAVHSLRAVSPEMISELVAAVDAVDPTAPIHIHVAEQPAEVSACVAQLGSRPVAWLADHVALSSRWSLVHATHVDDQEVERMARSGAVVVICPTTEANLGDGIFPADAFLAAGGQLAIGSDSHVVVDPAEELRLLEGGQRLTHMRRNILCQGQGSVGASLHRAVGLGGAASLGRRLGALEVGARADLVVLDTSRPRLWGRRGDTLLDTWVFASGREAVRDVFVAGEQVIAEGMHRHEVGVREGYRAAVSALATHVGALG